MIYDLRFTISRRGAGGVENLHQLRGFGSRGGESFRGQQAGEFSQFNPKG
jgi:hypothetical protein